MLIGISGKIGSGKDTIGKIIQYLTSPFDKDFKTPFVLGEDYQTGNSWEIKKFAGLLKQYVALATNCTVEQLEDVDFKNKPLSTEWNRFVIKSRKDSRMYLKINDNPLYYTTREAAVAVAEDVYEVEEIVMTRRLMLQLMGTDAMRNHIHPNFWVNALMSDYKPEEDYQEGTTPENLKWVEGEYPNWIITDTRFPNELEAVKKKGGISIRVERLVDSENKPIIRENEHPSETALDNSGFDYIIHNSGSIETLIALVKEILIQEKII